MNLQGDKSTELVTKYLHENIFQLDKLLEQKKITLGEYLNLAMQLKILEKLDRYEVIFKTAGVVEDGK